MNSNSSGKKLEGFFAGKGFYIVLFLCAAVIGVSAWMLAAGNETMAEDPTKSNSASLESKRVETVIIPAETETDISPADVHSPVSIDALDTEAPEVSTEGLAVNGELSDGEAVDVGHFEETDSDDPGYLYGWPIVGEIERPHDLDRLAYDTTMRDWRTHDGIDIEAPLGTTVLSAHAGSVESIEDDPMYGTVITVSHGDGGKTLYANLAPTPTVSVGDWVEIGTVLGSVGTTAICEIGQGTHLHFAITFNGESVNPLYYLPA